MNNLKIFLLSFVLLLPGYVNALEKELITIKGILPKSVILDETDHDKLIIMGDEYECNLKGTKCNLYSLSIKNFESGLKKLNEYRTNLSNKDYCTLKNDSSSGLRVHCVKRYGHELDESSLIIEKDTKFKDVNCYSGYYNGNTFYDICEVETEDGKVGVIDSGYNENDDRYIIKPDSNNKIYEENDNRNMPIIKIGDKYYVVSGNRKALEYTNKKYDIKDIRLSSYTSNSNNYIYYSKDSQKESAVIFNNEKELFTTEIGEFEVDSLLAGSYSLNDKMFYWRYATSRITGPAPVYLYDSDKKQLSSKIAYSIDNKMLIYDDYDKLIATDGNNILFEHKYNSSIFSFYGIYDSPSDTYILYNYSYNDTIAHEEDEEKNAEILIWRDKVNNGKDPEKPEEPEKPETPDKPEVPETPEKPEEPEKPAEETPEHKCEIVDGVYYDPKGNKVSKKDYLSYCGAVDQVHSGYAISIISMIVLGLIGLILYKQKGKNVFRKI